MLFLVSEPDSAPEASSSAASQEEKTATPASGDGQKDVSPPASSDAEEKRVPSSDNVELDLDNAPFLDDKEAEKEAAPEQPVSTQALEMPEKPAGKISWKERLLAFLSNKKRVAVFLGIALLLLLLVGLAVFFMLRPGGGVEEQSPLPPDSQPQAEPRTVLVPSKPESETGAAATLGHLVTWEPFHIPLVGPEGEVVMFTVALSMPVEDPTLQAEIQARLVVLRDAVYYYFSKKPLALLLSSKDAAALRDELVQVLNEHLTSGKITKVFIEEYFMDHL